MGRKLKRGIAHSPTTSQVYTDEESELIIAVNRWKHQTQTKFPAVTEYLAIFKSLGYQKQTDKEKR